MAQHRWDTSGPAVSGTGTAGTGTAGAGRAESPDPPGLRRRWALSLPAAVLAVCLLLGCAAAAVLLRDTGPAPVASVELSATASAARPDAQATANGRGTAGSSQPASAATSHGAAEAEKGPATVVVHVAGAVQRPGIVRLPPGSRIVDAVDGAGGSAADADLTAVNLAAPAQDGAMVLVPRIGEDAPPPTVANGRTDGANGGGTAAGVPAAGTDAGSARVNLNTADSVQLQTLPRVGPVLAERIIEWRSAHGSFSRPEDLDAVPGIGEAMMAALLPLVTV